MARDSKPESTESSSLTTEESNFELIETLKYCASRIVEIQTELKEINGTNARKKPIITVE